MSFVVPLSFPPCLPAKTSFLSVFDAFWRCLTKPETPPPAPPLNLYRYAHDCLTFEPGLDFDFITAKLTNCYSYARGLRVAHPFSAYTQPGQKGLTFLKYLLSQIVTSKTLLHRAAIADGLIPHDNAKSVPPGYYLVALMLRPGLLFGDYHWYRLDKNRQGDFIWTHKAGGKLPSDRDRDGNVIRDLSKAVLGAQHTRWGGYFLVRKN